MSCIASFIHLAVVSMRILIKIVYSIYIVSIYVDNFYCVTHLYSVVICHCTDTTTGTGTALALALALIHVYHLNRRIPPDKSM